MQITVEQTQKPILNQRQQHSLHILEMGAEQLDAYLAEQALGNPLIAYEKPSVQFPHPPSLSRAARNDDGDSDAYQNMLSRRHREVTLRAFLMEQADDAALPARMRNCLGFLVENLDARGYLDLHVDQIAALRGISGEEARMALRCLQSFEPAGVGARNLRECLLLQLKRAESWDPLTAEIIRNHLEDLSKQRYRKLAAELGVHEADVLRALDAIRRLNPKPGNGFAPEEDIPYALADLIVGRGEDGSVEIELNPALQFSFRVNGDYGAAICCQEGFGPEERAYLRERLDTARSISQGIQRRGNTLLECGRAIVERQHAFFCGDTALLLPHTMGDLAASLSLHASTITRALKNKSLCCERGTFPLSSFFSRAAYSNGDMEMTADSIRARIAAMIAAESGAAPLSDQRIVDMLAEEGIRISRRVVTKYREELGFLGSFARRRNFDRG